MIELHDPLPEDELEREQVIQDEVEVSLLGLLIGDKWRELFEINIEVNQ